MDPLSITTFVVSASSQAFTLTQTIRRFFKDGERLPQRILDLQDDLDSFIGVATSLKELLDDVPFATAVIEFQDSKHINCAAKIIQILKVFDERVERFQGILSAVAPRDGSNALSRGRRAQKLRDSGIDELQMFLQRQSILLNVQMGCLRT
jgi:hypothetical protein